MAPAHNKMLEQWHHKLEQVQDESLEGPCTLDTSLTVNYIQDESLEGPRTLDTSLTANYIQDESLEGPRTLDTSLTANYFLLCLYSWCV
jgi:hypothetical protein